jgi:PAS domain S-box-containing protein
MESVVYEQRQIVKNDFDERFFIMADCAPVMLWMAGTDSRCHFFNRPWLDFSGKTLEEEIGEGWLESVHFEDFQNCIDTYIENFSRRSEFRIEYRLKRHDGVYRWILDTGRPYYDPSGKFAGFIGSCIDITDLKELRMLEIEKARLLVRLEERERANEQLTEANKDLDTFTYNVSHDLRAPVRAINSFIKLYLEDSDAALPPKALRLIERVKEKGAQLDKLLDGLVSLSRPFQIPLAKANFNMKDMTDSVVASIMESNSAFKSTTIEISDMPSVYADEALVRQLLVNLIHNALKFSQKGKCPAVHVGHQGQKNGEDIFFVSDNGIGIGKNDQKKLFEIFRRFNTDYEGTGIGLTIVRKVINRHQGKIWVESELCKGCIFYFTLGSHHAQ